MGSSSIHLVRKRCSLRSQPVLQFREGPETGEHLGVSVRWGTGTRQEEGSSSSSLGEGGGQVVAEVLPLLPSSGVYPLHPSLLLTADCSFIVRLTMHGSDREPEISPLPGGGGTPR